MYTPQDRYKLFVIDDSVFIRNTLMDLLPELGFDVVGMASTAKNAFKYVAETRPDLVLLDTSIPEFTTEEIIRGLLAINKNLEIIILAPLSIQNNIAGLLRAGARDYIPKPLVPRQVEYVLRGYEISAGIRPPTEIQTIAQLYSLYLEELLKHSPVNVYKLIEKGVMSPLKRLKKKYPERYNIDFNPIRIKLKLAQESHSEKTYLMYKKQLARLFHSVANKLNKDLPQEYVVSLLIEAYESYYPLARYLLKYVDFRLPVWKKYEIESNNLAVLEQRIEARFDYEYLTNEEAMLHIDDSLIDPNTRIQPYRVMLRHDPRVAPRFPRQDSLSIDTLDIHVILSHFDEILGPRAISIVPPPHGRLEKDKLQSIPKFLDLVGANPGEPFIHSVSDYGSINLVFSIESIIARGGSKDYMLSIVISPAEIRVMIRINQLGALIRAVAAEIANHYRTHENMEGKQIISEPHTLLQELLEEIVIYLRTAN